MKSLICSVAMALSMFYVETAQAQLFRPQPRPAVVQNIGLKGGIVFLSEEEHTASSPAEVNVGGMLIVNVPDSGSRPSREIKVQAGQAFREIGTVAGAQTPEGVTMFGGGYTWCVFQATNAGRSTVRVRYRLNDETGSIVDREYSVVVRR